MKQQLRRAALALLVATVALGGTLAAHATEGVVNVNTATVAELERLPGIGEAKARAIVDYRKANGAFKAVEDLLEVKGIGDAGLERMRSQVVIQGKTTLRE